MIDLSGKKLSIEISSNLDDVKKKINLVLEKLGRTIKDDDIIFEIRTILTELVINGAVHGNLLDENKKVYLDIIMEDEYMTICVRDEGIGFEYCLDSYNVFDMKSSGRGLLMVSGLSDELSIENNEVHVRKKLKKDEYFDEHNISQTC